MKKRVKVNEYQEKKFNSSTTIKQVSSQAVNKRHTHYVKYVSIFFFYFISYFKVKFLFDNFLMIQMRWEACRLTRSMHLKYYLLITETSQILTCAKSKRQISFLLPISLLLCMVPLKLFELARRHDKISIQSRNKFFRR